MDISVITGIILAILGLAFITYITFRSRFIISRIASRKSANTREMLNDLNNGR
jgi:hypothetical protein